VEIEFKDPNNNNHINSPVEIEFKDPNKNSNKYESYHYLKEQ